MTLYAAFETTVIAAACGWALWHVATRVLKLKLRRGAAAGAAVGGGAACGGCSGCGSSAGSACGSGAGARPVTIDRAGAAADQRGS
ncbi:hypothetical protein [Sphaerotilus uruguayifluvii]|uniref:FeoB-associated Cys-rich membrane protein n=1 Tax=Sphaerotilus uruguayifluvii TaxID=2735897 RepID=A0ABX2G105_9BURK|nr:hypothetical protein [Leptothrix sp. C29]NRT55118.1 hypothetical protein [Leptothrix sp. C29]